MRLALSLFLSLLPAMAAADEAAKPDLSRAILLPQKADAARRAGVDNQEIQEALGAAKEGGLSAAEAGDVLEAAVADAPTDAGRGLGPAVRDAVKSGKRGQELAAEIKRLRAERMAADGKGAGGHGHDHGKGDAHDHGKGDAHDHGKGDAHDHGKGDGHDHGKGDAHDHGKGVGPGEGAKGKGEAGATHGSGKGGKPVRADSGESAEAKGKAKPAPASNDGGKTKPAPKN